MNRAEAVAAIDGQERPWDVLVIGGGASGLGTALEAASRGHRTLLLEGADFGQGTSSRSTKLIHGGLRYLRQGRIGVVRESLCERETLLRNAPHLVHPLGFVIPCFRWWEKPFYHFGLCLYHRLSGSLRLGRAGGLSKAETLERLPGMVAANVTGGVHYEDGQFDDAQLLISLLRTLLAEGGHALNHCRVVKLRKKSGRVCGVIAQDELGSREFEIEAKVVVNATGIFSDELRRLDDPQTLPNITASQGIHLVLPRKFMPGKEAIMIPKTHDGRVLFIIPWHDHLLVGTTDSARDKMELEPRASSEDIDYLLGYLNHYLEKPVGRKDVLSCFAGLRPLMGTAGGGKTSRISRDYQLATADSGLITLAGGKWTTYRAMGEATVNQAEAVGHLKNQPSRTRDLKLFDQAENEVREIINRTPDLEKALNPDYPWTEAHVIHAVRNQFANQVEDVLSRRLRALPLNAQAATAMAARVAELMADELERNDAWQTEQVAAFRKLAADYLP
jgi:glycerol-3-phosphate dehydrogenase